jgi:hypothetical protein
MAAISGICKSCLLELICHAWTPYAFSHLSVDILRRGKRNDYLENDEIRTGGDTPTDR